VADLENLKGLEVLRIRSGKNLSATAKQSLRQNLPNLYHFTADNDRVFKKKKRGGNRGKVAPAFEATTLNGKEIKLDDYSGKVVLLYFWSTSCTPCIKSADSLKKFYDRTRNEHPDFEMISISTDDSDQRVRIHIEEYKHSWPQVRVGAMSKLAADYGVEGLPRYVLVKRDGVIAHDGHSDKDMAKWLEISLER
jgi:peroxiredoxin